MVQLLADLIEAVIADVLDPRRADSTHHGDAIISVGSSLEVAATVISIVNDCINTPLVLPMRKHSSQIERRDGSKCRLSPPIS